MSSEVKKRSAATIAMPVYVLWPWPGFVLGNVHVLPGLPSEMKAMFDAIADRFRGRPIATWRRKYETTEGQIVGVLEEATRRHPAVTVGSYPRFRDGRPEVDVVLKSADKDALAEVTDWIESALDERIRAKPG